MGLYVLGLDGGGTKTLAQATDETGADLFRVGGGALNPNSETPDRVRATVREILDEAVRTAGAQPAAVCVAAAGVSNPDARRLLEQAVRDAGFEGPLSVTGDHMAALAGALGRPEGMILIAGTGSICAGQTADGRTARAGGRGHLIDDEGSGYAMGRDVLRAVVEAEDGRGPATCLTERVYRELGAENLGDVVSFVYAPECTKRDIAALAKLLPEAAAEKDEAALAIYDRAGRELARLAAAVAKQLELSEGELALAGSALRNDEQLRRCLNAHLAQLAPGIVTVLPRQDAAFGAALLARQLLKGAV